MHFKEEVVKQALMESFINNKNLPSVRPPILPYIFKCSMIPNFLNLHIQQS